MYLSMLWYLVCQLFFFFKQKTAYEMRISDWSSDVCSSDLAPCAPVMKVLRPLITQWLPLRWQVVFIIDGSDPAPPSSAGSVIKKAQRMRPSTLGSRKRAGWPRGTRGRTRTGRRPAAPWPAWGDRKRPHLNSSHQRAPRLPYSDRHN